MTIDPNPTRAFLKFTIAGIVATAAIPAIGAGVEPADADVAALKTSYSAQVIDDHSTPDEVTNTGYRRTYETLRQPMPEGGVAAEDNDKLLVIDPQTGELIVPHIVDQLPIGWRFITMDGGETDSLGRPIVNRMTGLPAWSQADVDALRAAINDHAALVRAGEHSPEFEHVFGNLISQALTRRIDVSDLNVMSDNRLMTAGVIDAALAGVAHYEATKMEHLVEFGGDFAAPAYRPEARALFAAAGFDPAAVPQSDSEQEEGGVADSNCYATNTSERGVTTLTGSTVLWDHDGTDDATADVPIGFDFRAFPCEERGANFNVRVATNGLLSFFERGGNAAVNVENWINTFLPDATAPNGIVAGWWDDLQVEVAQGIPDRIHYKTEGAAPYRVFTTEWSSISRRGGLTTDYHWFQIKLYELTGRIEIVIDIDDGLGYDTADNASVGIENFSATDSDCGPNCTNLITWDNQWLRLHRYLTRLTANDTCQYAIQVFDNQTVTADLITAWMGSATAACGESAGNRDVWYTFVAPSRGVLRLDACGTIGAGGSDSVLSIYDTCAGDAAALLACNDDRISWADAPNNNCGSLDSYVATVMNQNQQVYIRASHYSDWLFGAFVQMDVRFVPSRLGDLNCDGRVNNFDIDPFVQLIANPDGWAAEHPSCDPMNGDMNGDGVVNNFDIDAFVLCLTVGC